MENIAVQYASHLESLGNPQGFVKSILRNKHVFIELC